MQLTMSWGARVPDKDEMAFFNEAIESVLLQIKSQEMEISEGIAFIGSLVADSSVALRRASNDPRFDIESADAFPLATALVAEAFRDCDDIASFQLRLAGCLCWVSLPIKESNA